MTAPTDAADNRRPIAARELQISRRAASFLCRRGVSANAISLAGMIAGCAGGAMLALTAGASGAPAIFWLAAAAAIQLRLAANMLDGMVALETGTASSRGALMNEIPDRVSDTAILVGLGYAACGAPVLGYVAALAAMATAYVRAVGVATGAPADFGGPMAKPHRMFVVTLASLVAAAMTISGRPAFVVATLGVAQAALWIIIVGSLVTMCRRLARIARALGKS